MSTFYRRYIASSKKSEESKLKDKVSTTSKQDDPSSMASSTSKTTVGSSVFGSAARRIQIFNSSDSFAPDSGKDIKTFAKPEAAKTFLRSAISGHYLFENLSEKDTERIIDCMRPSFSEKDENIIKQGELGDLFFCLEAGTADAVVDGNTVFTYTGGKCFGELALLYNAPRAATVVATQPCKLWTLDLKTFRYILATTASSSKVNRCVFLKNCKFRDALDNEQIGKVAGALSTYVFEDGEYIIKQGEKGDDFFIVEEGTVKCTQVKSDGKEYDLITLSSGDYFGEMSLMLKDTRYANCIAVGQVRCLSLSASDFSILLGPIQTLLAGRMRMRILQSVPLLSKLTDAKLTKLSAVMRVQNFKEGQYIIKQGEDGSRFYIINDGEVKCVRTDPNTKKEEEIGRLRTQDFFGERALVKEEERTASVIAVTSVECLVLERSSFENLLSGVQDDILEEMSKRETAKDSDAKEEANLQPRTSYKYEDLKIMRTVGTGTFGRVKLVQHKPSGAVCALKCMSKAQVVESHQEKNIMGEKNLLFECSSSNFVLQLLQTYTSRDQIFMLMEFVQGGELWSYIYEKYDTIKRSNAGGFEYPAVRFYAANVLMAVHHLHSKNIAYRDMKPENLLMNSNGYLKMIDFGFAKKFPFQKNGTRQDKTYTLCGTPEYLAPEIVMSKGYDKSVDYWAFGCFVYELFCGKTPFQADYTTKIFQNIIASDKVLQFHDQMEKSHVELCKGLLKSNASFRLGNLNAGVKEIIDHPFFASLNWKDIENQTAPAPYCPPIGDALDTSNFDEYEEEKNITVYKGSQEHFKDF